jgi:hypothetical protein
MPTDEPLTAEVCVRRLHRRDLNRTWEFLKLVFRDVHRETVEYQRPRSKARVVDIDDAANFGDTTPEQLHHLARVRGCTHLVLEVAENNTDALRWYRKRNFFKLDAAIVLAQKVATPPELLPPRRRRGTTS